MKKLLIIVAVGLATTTMALAQGQLNFANGASGVNAPISDANDVKLAGAAYVAGLWWGAGTVTDPNLLAFANFTSPFGTLGYFSGGAKTITGPAIGDTITAQVRVWDVAHGSTYEAVKAAQGGQWGASVLIPGLKLGGGITLPPNLVGLQSFKLTLNPVPEPSTLALAGLGLAAMLVIRRRK